MNELDMILASQKPEEAVPTWCMIVNVRFKPIKPVGLDWYKEQTVAQSK